MTSTSSPTPFCFITIILIFINMTTSFSNAACNITDPGCNNATFVTSVQSTIQASLDAISVINSQHGAIQTNDNSEIDISNALNDCVELLDDSVDHLHASIHDPTGVQCMESSSPCTSISAALANQEICIEGLDIRTDNTTVKQRVIEVVAPLKSLMTNLLTMVQTIESHPIPTNNINANKESITWLSTFNITYPDKANATVALDGTGDYKSIIDAVNAAPNKSETRFVIHLKKGVYEEYVKIPKYKTNIVLIGEGQDVSIITGNRSYTSGYKTYHTATVVVSGCGFMAKHITIQNTAGPEGHQAVAMRSNANNLVFYQCTFNGYQDTLYARSGRQFFRECEIRGTVDFIFGDASAMFQKCSILARKPMKGQFNTITAQGRAVACSDTGFSFHMCGFLAGELMEEETQTYMGRPWRNHSRTVVMKSFMGELINKEGWMDWDNRSTLDTIYYGEYMNRGYGADVKERVKWPGFHVIVNESEAMNFTVGRFIDGDQWLPSTGVPYVSGINEA